MTNPAAIDPDLALELAKATADAYAEATEQLIAIVSRQTRAGTDDPDGWATRKLAELQDLQARSRSVVDRLAADTPGLVDTAVRSAYNVGAGMPLATHTRAVDQLIHEAVTRLESTYGQILRSVADDYRTIITKASTLVTTGAFSLGQAQRAALDDFAKKGITGFTDRAGRRWRLDRYAEMSTRTAVGRAQVAGTLDRLVGDGRDLVIVSDHHGACQVCAPFEGKVLSISGTSTGHVEDGNGDSQPILGSVADAQAAGLQHPNCRHSMAAFIPGLSIPPEPRDTPTDGVQRRREQNTADEQVRAGRRREAARTGKAPKGGGRGGGGRPPKPPTSRPGDGPPEPPDAWKAAVAKRSAPQRAAQAAAHGMTPAEFRAAAEQHLAGLSARADVYTRITPKNLEAVLQDGRFKTQFETGHSGGALTLPGRRSAEHELWGIPAKAPPSARPIYGYAAEEPFKDQILDLYDLNAGISVRFKPSVKRRATITVGDTLDKSNTGGTPGLAPAPYDAPTLEAVYRKVDPLEMRAHSDDLVGTPGNYRPLPYSEVQIFGNVTVDDIAEVLIKKTPNNPGMIPARNRLTAALKRAGIPYRVVP